MQDARREILVRVRSGELSPEKAAELLDAALGRAAAGAGPPEDAAFLAGIRAVRVVGSLAAVSVRAEVGLVGAVAAGPHQAHLEGDVLIIETQSQGDRGFHFAGGGRRRFPWRREDEPVEVRMNPALPLAVELKAGSLRVRGVTGPIETEISAGSARIEDFAGPLTVAISAGSLTAQGRLTGGSSRIRCEAGTVRLQLESGSSVRIRARASLGKVRLGDDVAQGVGAAVRELTLGSGSGTLDIDCSMGSVRVDCQ